MSYLLDTYTFIWAVHSPEMLPKQVVELLENPENDIQVSVISFWEIALKYSIGKLELKNVKPEDFPILARDTGFSVLSLSAEDVSTSYQLEWLGNHKDPFDRILIWQALQSKSTVISKDADFDQYQSLGLKLLW